MCEWSKLKTPPNSYSKCHSCVCVCVSVYIYIKLKKQELKITTYTQCFNQKFKKILENPDSLFKMSKLN